ALATADVVISCIGAPGLVVSTRSARAAAHARTGRPQVYLDLALPHDVDHAVGDLPGVTRLGLEHLGTILATVGASPQVQQAADIVTAEVAAYLTDRAALEAAPTISALRGRASEVLEAELARLTSRTPELTDEQRREVEIAMGRLVDKLLHGPTVRVKELAARGDLAEYAEALALLFALDPHTVAAVSSPPPFESPGFASEPEATR
ncbi:MAG: glutamyl-tRNA reductase, partial [Nostocoides sp.]